MSVYYRLSFDDIESYQNAECDIWCKGDLQAVDWAAELIKTYAKLWHSSHVDGIGKLSSDNKDSSPQDFWIEWDNGDYSYGYFDKN